ncbi:MAG: hypothetical protein EOO73_24000 [Myxococcales bacterium]|nr:MAG: hypothetical protein EOO73_24000 [Myxococcales bacterium]
MNEVLLYAGNLALGIAIPAGIVRYDVARLRGDELARAWPDSSVWSAVVAFGPLCLPLHFIRTRRSWAGLGLGAISLVIAVVLIVLPFEAPFEGIAAIFCARDLWRARPPTELRNKPA